MWTPWIDAAARLSEKNESNTNDHKSSWGSEAIKEHYIAPAASNMQSAAEVKIRRAIRHSTELQVNSSKHLQMKFRRNIRRLSEIYPGVLQEDGDSVANLEKIPQAQADRDRVDPRRASMRYKSEGSDTKMKAFLQDVDVADPKDKEMINPQEKDDELVHE